MGLNFQEGEDLETSSHCQWCLRQFKKWTYMTRTCQNGIYYLRLLLRSCQEQSVQVVHSLTLYLSDTGRRISLYLALRQMESTSATFVLASKVKLATWEGGMNLWLRSLRCSKNIVNTRLQNFYSIALHRRNPP